MERKRHPFDAIPELAGVATYKSAAQVGLSVTDNVRLLLRYQWSARRLMQTMVAHIPSMPVWEVKCALALHQWQCAEHVEALRKRVSEMRSPVPNLDARPEGGSVGKIDQRLDALAEGDDPAKVVTTIYKECLPALAAAYRKHIKETNPLVDHPTRRLLKFALIEIEEAIAWGKEALKEIKKADKTADKRADMKADKRADMRTDKRAEVKAGRRMRFHPIRDKRFTGSYNFEFPPHVVFSMPNVPADERNLALLCKRALEMDVPEMMASFMVERTGESWEFYHDYARQLWDEARHAMMGTVAFERRRIDWKRDIPLNISFALRLNLHATPLERQTMLYAIEQSLMPAETGKRFEYETAVEAGDKLSAHFHDYDWADEVLHAQIGRRMLKRDGITTQRAFERAKEIHEKTWAALEQYRDPRSSSAWWPALVRKVLRKPSAVNPDELGEINVFSE